MKNKHLLLVSPATRFHSECLLLAKAEKRAEASSCLCLPFGWRASRPDLEKGVSSFTKTHTHTLDVSKSLLRDTRRDEIVNEFSPKTISCLPWKTHVFRLGSWMFGLEDNLGNYFYGFVVPLFFFLFFLLFSPIVIRSIWPSNENSITIGNQSKKTDNKSFFFFFIFVLFEFRLDECVGTTSVNRKRQAQLFIWIPTCLHQKLTNRQDVAAAAASV